MRNSTLLLLGLITGCIGAEGYDKLRSLSQSEHRKVAVVAEATGDSQREVIRKVNRGQKAHYGIRPATEALLLAAAVGVDIAPFLDEAWQGLARD